MLNNLGEINELKKKYNKLVESYCQGRIDKNQFEEEKVILSLKIKELEKHNGHIPDAISIHRWIVYIFTIIFLLLTFLYIMAIQDVLISIIIFMAIVIWAMGLLLISHKYSLEYPEWLYFLPFLPLIISFYFYGTKYLYDANYISGVVWLFLAAQYYNLFIRRDLPEEFRRNSEIWLRARPEYEDFYFNVLKEIKEKPKSFNEVYYDIFINPGKKTLKEKIAPTFWRKTVGLKKVLSDLESWGLVKVIQEYEKATYSLTDKAIKEAELYDRQVKREKEMYKFKYLIGAIIFITWLLGGIHWIFF